MRDLYNPYRSHPHQDILSGIGPEVEIFGTQLTPTVVSTLGPVGPPLPAGFHGGIGSHGTSARPQGVVSRVILGLVVAGMSLAMWLEHGVQPVQAQSSAAEVGPSDQ